MADDTRTAQLLNDALAASRDDLERIDADIKAIAVDDQLEAKVPDNHMADSGSNIFERERLMTLRIEYEQRLRLIEDAQERLQAGSYGICQRCSQPIAPERLEALPFAAYCISCQEIVDSEQEVGGVKPYQPLTP